MKNTILDLVGVVVMTAAIAVPFAFYFGVL